MSTEIKQFDVIDAAIAQLTKDYNHLPECSTEEGFEQAKTDYKTIRRFEIDLEDKRNKLLAASRKKIKTINAEASGIDGRLKKISSPFKSAIDIRKEEIKEAETKRIADLKAEISSFQNFVSDGIGKTSVQISELIESVDLIEVDEQFDEFQAEAREALNSVKAKLSEMLTLKIQSEIDEQKAAEIQAEKDKVQAENDRILLEQQQAKDKLKKRNQDIIDEQMLGYDYLIVDELDELLEMDTYDLSVLLKERKDAEIERVVQAEEIEQPEEKTQAEVNGETAKSTIEKRQYPQTSSGYSSGYISHKPNDPDCSVEETGTSDMSLMEAINEWVLDCNIGLVEVQKLSAILKERGLI